MQNELEPDQGLSRTTRIALDAQRARRGSKNRARSLGKSSGQINTEQKGTSFFAFLVAGQKSANLIGSNFRAVVPQHPPSFVAEQLSVVT